MIKLVCDPGVEQNIPGNYYCAWDLYYPDRVDTYLFRDGVFRTISDDPEDFFKRCKETFIVLEIV